MFGCVLVIAVAVLVRDDGGRLASNVVLTACRPCQAERLGWNADVRKGEFCLFLVQCCARCAPVHRSLNAGEWRR